MLLGIISRIDSGRATPKKMWEKPIIFIKFSCLSEKTHIQLCSYKKQKRKYFKMRGLKKLKLTTRGRYAVMAMVELAQKGGKDPVPLIEIAQSGNISLSYLEQLFAGLRKHGLVKSYRGLAAVTSWRVRQPKFALPKFSTRQRTAYRPNAARRTRTKIISATNRPASCGAILVKSFTSA